MNYTFQIINFFLKKKGKIKRGTLSHLAPRTNRRTVYPGGRGAPHHGGARAPGSRKPLSPRPFTFRHVRAEPAWWGWWRVSQKVPAQTEGAGGCHRPRASLNGTHVSPRAKHTANSSSNPKTGKQVNIITSKQQQQKKNGDRSLKIQHIHKSEMNYYRKQRTILENTCFL